MQDKSAVALELRSENRALHSPVGEEAWRVRLALPGLPKRGGEHDGGEEVGDRIVEVGVLGQPV